LEYAGPATHPMVVAFVSMGLFSMPVIAIYSTEPDLCSQN
jgi:hypothetical protein